jgi:hypothetical protein
MFIGPSGPVNPNSRARAQGRLLFFSVLAMAGLFSRKE